MGWLWAMIVGFVAILAAAGWTDSKRWQAETERMRICVEAGGEWVSNWGKHDCVRRVAVPTAQEGAR